jgi:sortase A
VKVLIRKKSLGSTLKWAQRGLFAVAALMLGYSGYVIADALIFQSRENAALERFVPAGRAAGGVTLPSAVGPDGLIGRIEIQRLGVSVIVVEGTAHRTFRRAAGHIAGTALPGEPGNIGIAGHRDTFFRPLRNIERDDIIALTTLSGEYRYRVVSTRVVSPSDTAVLDSDGNEILTLVTCYPFYFVGSAPERFIVRAARIT